MALNQNAHRRNQELYNEAIKKQRERERKYNITRESAAKSLVDANEKANTYGKLINKFGQKTNNKIIQSIGEKITENSGNNLQNKFFNFAKDKISSLTNKGANAQNVSSTASNASNALNNANNVSNATNVANTASNASNMANTASNVSNATSNASNIANASSTASNASSTASNAPVVGTALGAISAGNNLAKKDYANAGLDTAKTAAAFIPVYGWIVSAAISAFQQARNMYLGKKMEAHQKTQAEAAKETEKSVMDANEAKQKIANKRANIQQQMASENPINGQLGDGSLKQMGMPSTQDITNEFKQEPVGNFAEKGNIDLFNRPVTQNEDGTISTVRSMSFNDGNHEVLIPTVADDGAILSEEDAINNYFQTGKHLGKFNSVEDANQYAENLHNQQEGLYGGVMTGGAAPVDSGFDDSTLPASEVSSIERNKALRSEIQRDNRQTYYDTKNKILNKVFDRSSDLPGTVLYDYASQETKDNNGRRIADSINKEINKNNTSVQPNVEQQKQPNQTIDNTSFESLTPEQQARYLQATGANGAVTQNGTKTPVLEGTVSQDTLPALPKASPTPSTTSFDPSQFEYINPDGTTAPASVATQNNTSVATQQAPQAVEQPVVQESPVIFENADDKKSTIANILSKVKYGRDENLNSTFDPENITAKTYKARVQDKDGNIAEQDYAKDKWHRVGEALGTGQKLLSNPAIQGLIAGAIYKATGGDTGESINYGVNWAQNKNKSDFYQKQLDPNSKPGIYGGVTAQDWQTKENIERAKAQQQTAQANLEEERKRNKLKEIELMYKLQEQEKQQQAALQKQKADMANKQYKMLMDDLNGITLTPERRAQVEQQIRAERVKALGY